MKKMTVYPLLSLMFAVTLFIPGCDNLTPFDESGPPVYDFSAVANALDAFIKEFRDPGAHGTFAWVDTARECGAYFAL